MPAWKAATFCPYCQGTESAGKPRLPWKPFLWRLAFYRWQRGGGPICYWRAHGCGGMWAVLAPVNADCWPHPY